MLRLASSVQREPPSNTRGRLAAGDQGMECAICDGPGQISTGSTFAASATAAVLHKNIFRQGHDDRTRPPLHGDTKGSRDQLGKASRIIHLDHPFGHAAKEVLVVQLLGTPHALACARAICPIKRIIGVEFLCRYVDAGACVCCSRARVSRSRRQDGRSICHKRRPSWPRHLHFDKQERRSRRRTVHRVRPDSFPPARM